MYRHIIYMNVNRLLFLSLLGALLFTGSCKNSGKNINGFTSRIGRAAMVDKYPREPGEEIFRQASGSKLYNELEDRYKQSLQALQIETDRDGAKLVVVIMTPDVGKSLSLSNTYGVPYIVQACNLLGIDCLDLSTVIGGQETTALTQGPSEGNWSKDGSAFLSDQLSYLLLSYDCFKNTKPFPHISKPATFGDMPPRKDEVTNGEKDVPYHITSNAQGLRMDHELTFPKTKQTILFLGDAQLYSPYLDDKFIATYLLQKKYPAKEIINAGYMHYTLEDHLSLSLEKARFTEPDIVVVCTNGDDILDYFFTQRNRYSRAQRVYRPSDAEKEFYEHLN